MAKKMTHEELMTKRAVTQICLAANEIEKGNGVEALLMLNNAVKQVKAITGTPEEKLIDAVLGKVKISITLPNDLYENVKARANELQISVSTCITMLLNKDIELEKK